MENDVSSLTNNDFLAVQSSQAGPRVRTTMVCLFAFVLTILMFGFNGVPFTDALQAAEGGAKSAFRGGPWPLILFIVTFFLGIAAVSRWRRRRRPLCCLS